MLVELKIEEEEECWTGVLGTLEELETEDDLATEVLETLEAG